MEAGGEGGGGGQEKKGESVVFFEGIAVPGKGANHVSVKPLQRKTAPKTFSLGKFFILMYHACSTGTEADFVSDASRHGDNFAF